MEEWAFNYPIPITRLRHYPITPLPHSSITEFA